MNVKMRKGISLGEKTGRTLNRHIRNDKICGKANNDFETIGKIRKNTMKTQPDSANI